MHPLVVTAIKEAIVIARDIIVHTYIKKTPQETIQVAYVHEKVLDGAALQKFIEKTTKELNEAV